MSFSSSLLLFFPKFPNSSPIFKTLTLSSFPLSPPKNLSIIKSITIQSIPTNLYPPNSISSSSPDSKTNTLQPIEELPQKLQEIINLFQSVQDPRAKYQQLLFYGKNLKPLETQFKTNENKVTGCVSQVWLRAYFDSDKKTVLFDADSDSVLTKGLAALLVQGLSGHPVQEILRVSPDFIVLLGLQQSLTPSRNNGFLNMLKLMQKKALTLYVEAEKGFESGNEIQNPSEKVESDSRFVDPIGNSEVGLNPDDSGSNSDSRIDNPIGNSESNSDSRFDNPIGNSEIGLNHDDSGPNSDSVNVDFLGIRGQRISEILKRELRPIELEVKDVSYQHAGHSGVRGSNGETHFNLKVVSNEFEGKSMVKRHRLVYSLLENELRSGLHALSIDAKTRNEISH